MKGPLECCGVDNLYLSPDGKQMQCRLCGHYHRAPVQGYPTQNFIRTTIWELLQKSRVQLEILQVKFSCHEKEITPAEQLNRGYFNMWIWLKHGPTWAQEDSVVLPRIA